jgi:predicted nucleic acid-binding protein
MLLRSQMEHVIPTLLGNQVCRDADDDQILGTASAGKATCIVTGDRDLLILQRYDGIEILSPANFANFERSAG